MPEVYIGLGSNIEPESNLRDAVHRLTDELGSLECSSVYRSPAHGFRGADFLNLVVRSTSGAGAAAVDAVLTRIEDAAGRTTERRGSRTLDLDLLLYGARVDGAARLPRRDVLEYAFVLAPLAELAPAGVHPVTGERYADAWCRLAARGDPLARLGPFPDALTDA